jgi:hypothetical protein
MPGGNRQGPLGQGPLSGRGAGYCGGSARPGYATAGSRGFGGRGLGRGNGRGRRGGRRNRRGQDAWATPQPPTADPPSDTAAEEISEPSRPAGPEREEELAELREQASQLAESLRELTSRLQRMESPDRAVE